MVLFFFNSSSSLNFGEMSSCYMPKRTLLVHQYFFIIIFCFADQSVSWQLSEVFCGFPEGGELQTTWTDEKIC